MLPFTLQQLRIFKAIATEKNFTKAGEFLYLSQPSVSKQIQIVEKNLEILLINRETHEISLTENGKIFLEYSERILALCEESCQALIDLKDAERGNLIIGTSQRIEGYVFPKILELFTQNYPQINFNFEVNSPKVITKNIINGTINFAIVGGEIPEKLTKNLIIENFLEDEFNLIISKSHPLARKKIITKRDLCHLNFISLNSDLNIPKFICNILSRNQIKTRQLKTIMQLNSIEGIKIAVNLGLGAAFLSSVVIEKEIQLQTVEILKIENIRIRKILTIISNSQSYQA